MRYLADFHIHSCYSRATSKASNLQGLAAWSQVKGINVVGSGDFTHPAWLAQIKDELQPAEPGLFKLKTKSSEAFVGASPEAIETRFVLTSEISSIYKRHGKVRKVHNVIFAPDLQSVERINAKLAAIGNIESDGRPILGLDSRDLLEILLENAPGGFLVPAHIWTPWFSLFGSKSGFDAIEECYGDLTEHIFALETGLSSDPDMNRLISALDGFTLISNSDCHSPSKLGREVNIFDTGLDFFAMRSALQSPIDGGFKGTIEFFPEEGKYHFDGHRKCQVCLDPLTSSNLTVCPVCQRPLTIGVSHRVMELADRETPFYPEGQPGYKSIIPLPEVLGEMLSVGPASKSVQKLYARLINKFGSEFNILLRVPEEELNQVSPVLGEAIRRIRNNQVIRHAGYDGEFGVIQLFEPGELDELSAQINLFSSFKRKKARQGNPASPPVLPFLQKTKAAQPEPRENREPNPEQLNAITCQSPMVLVNAGPGTGKTYTLIERIIHQLKDKRLAPESIAAITFTNKAAEELRDRLEDRTGSAGKAVFSGTFHAFCLSWLRSRKPDLLVLGPDDRELLLKNLFPTLSKRARQELNAEISEYFNALGTGKAPAPAEQVSSYLTALRKDNCIDLEAVIPYFIQQLQNDKALWTELRHRVKVLLVDEFQDVNRSQYELVRLIAENADIFAIGDPNQAIYGFRGSDLRFFFRLKQDAPTDRPVTTFTLTRSYRSAPEIIQAANEVIRHNPQPGECKLYSQVKKRGEIELYRAVSPAAEAEFVVRRIEELMGGVSNFSINSGRGGASSAARAFGDFAVLYRLNSLAAPLSEALERRGLPCQQAGGAPFYTHPGVKGLYYLVLCAASQATIAEHIQLCQTLDIGTAALSQLEKIPLTAKSFFDSALAFSLTEKAKDRLLRVKALRDSFRAALKDQPIPEALAPGLQALGIEPDNADSKRFIELAGVFGHDLPAFATHLRANARAAVYDERAEAVSLMSLHAAKGLEFPVVFICGLEEKNFPHFLTNRPCDIEEERRLFYVALTRAREHVILTSSDQRTIFGKAQTQEVSRFINEIPPSLVRLVSSSATGRKHTASKQLSLF